MHFTTKARSWRCSVSSDTPHLIQTCNRYRFLRLVVVRGIALLLDPNEMPTGRYRFPCRNPDYVRLPTARSESADSLQTDTAQIAVSNRWLADARKRQNRAQTRIKLHDSASGT